ncbi:putative transporter YcxC [Paenibacillus baekrokdamisoli]|uniref:Putative transporter YcxC n=1 Tax=Paenibacillus baekrokdamisoli TaxID=1712516 RepID=A0A3G9JCC4_9BACL|nr:DMT family transporter [Paenibacillus baekrokdamisoli]MBB3068759.1 drug/metabolite transporter (DMT)-like permease [Paenibacillus baekrokdamisoli]BBH23591.1 putative transporter YcxC [Paenibacillus baekrokdamisoli]
MSSTQKAYTAALLYTIIIGFSFMFVKVALTAASPIDTLAHRFTLALLAASIPLLMKKVKFTMKWKDFLSILPLALLYPTIFFAFQVFGLTFSSSSEAGIIQASIPVFTLVLASFLLGETSTLQQKLATFISTVGVVYIFAMKGFNLTGSSFIGSILILLSAISAASYNVLARKLTKKYSLYELTYVMLLIGFIAFNAAALVQHQAANTLTSFFQPFTNSSFVLSILFLGVLSSFGTALLSNYALSILKASQMSVFSNLATLMTMVAGVLFLNEQLHYFHIIGAILIIGGVISTQVNFKKNKQTMLKEK